MLGEALRETRGFLAELERLGEELARIPQHDPGHQVLLDTYGRRLEQAQHRESWAAGRRAALVLDGPKPRHGRPRPRAGPAVRRGQRGRLALAALLVRRPWRAAARRADQPSLPSAVR
ncbi:hypothetical protein Srubr_28310 [Streptomyces rubradiris]|uniref:Uncharacterized protein n=1 Tax=Streptomyces rubradiris TaxID=285531 RepID=A0ABQ3RAW0_STRRR|nr:hypothetical protein GCM10018792_51190 [Streptomyces rubradiris]GHI52985.1 hypothetical protein Srubr_28310 [Streptomyces rubradiris]